MTQMGRFKLIHKGYEYTKSYSNSYATYWRCAQARRGYCKGKARSKQIGQRHMMGEYDTHNHKPENDSMDLKQ